MKIRLTQAGKLRAAAIGASLALIVACSSTSDPIVDKSTAGQVIGGVAGAAAGSQIGGGSGRTIAMITGALIGSVVGERIGAKMEERDLQRTAEVLENNRRSDTETWINPNTGHEFAVTPVDTWQQDGRPCREFEFTVETERGRETEERTACRLSDGTWEVLG